MNAEALVGKVLGTCTLRRVIGQGSMGAVYLARQSQPRREVVVKVFLQASALVPLQYIDFLVRFRREVDAVASFKHPNILSIYEYGERDGFVYLVMPYISGQSLENMLKRQKMLPFPKVMDYLDQLAAAFDYAHERGVLHLDIKPANILVTADDKVFLTDFALSKTMTEEQAAQVRQFRVGMLDYMAPEQVMGKETGERADVYSLGAVLYHMVTGSAPFQGESLMEVATKHLEAPPPSPCSKRADLPLAAEQAMLRALAKRPTDRYAHAQDLATTFRLALAVTHREFERTQNDMLLSSNITSTGLYTPHGLFDPKWRTDFMPVDNSELTSSQSSYVLPATASTPSTGVFASIRNLALHSEQEIERENAPLPIPAVNPNPITPLQDTPMFPEQTTNPTGVLTLPGTEQGTTGTIMKLTSPAKIVNMPVAGQPGRYLIGLLPTFPTTRHEGKELSAGTIAKHHMQKRFKIIGLVMVVLLLLGTGTFWFTHLRSSSTSKTQNAMTIARTPDVRATMAAGATATANANIILLDPLTRNIHNWPIVSSGSMIYVFKDEAYHITDNDNTRGAPAILPDLILKGPFVYTLTTEEIKGDDTSINNEYGMIIRASIQNKNSKTITTFYSFEVLNKAGGEYQFWKYDDSQGSTVSPWKKLGYHPFGKEFHEGQGPKSINTFKIIANGKNFTLLVNGKQVWTVQDSSFASGGVGMLVNLKGTEVAFSNLTLTNN
jgi:serine/threonine protein kinase